MKIAVFGAAGRTGKEVVTELVRRGHAVVALDMYVPDDNMGGSVAWVRTNPTFGSDDFEKVLKSCDGIISTIGHVKGSPDMTQTDTIKQISNAVPKDTRLISLTGTGVRMPQDTPSLIDRVLNVVVAIIDPKRIEDGKQHVEVLKKSECNYTVLRVLKLTSGKARESYSLTQGGPAQLLTPRKLVARVMCDLVESQEWTRELPVL